MAGNSITNNAGGHSFNYAMEIQRQIEDEWALSVTFLNQGDDETRTDRKALGGQIWQVIPITENWTFLGGIGPLWGRNTRGQHDSEFDGLITFRVERAITETRPQGLCRFQSTFLPPTSVGCGLFRVGSSHAF
jgi:hypothetical protein